MFNGAQINEHTPRSLLHGAMIAIVAATFGTMLELLFHSRLEAMNQALARSIRIVLFTLAGCFGFVVGGGLARVLLWNMGFFQMSGRIAYPMIISSVIAAVLGLSFYTFERMRDSLRESVIKLKEQEFAAKELEIAREIQQRLLPPEDLSGDGYRISARNLAARFVAGDFYDVFRTSDGRLGIVVADVAGKGMGASLIMASAKAVLPLIAEGRGAAEALQLLNTKLSKELGRREFVALAYARFDPHSGEVELANAGLPDPYVIHDGRVDPIVVPGARLPLGAMKQAVYESTTLHLRRGDRLMMFTDGLPEATMRSGEALGYERLPEFLASRDGDATEWLDAVLKELRDKTVESLEDDWTALVLERV